MDKCGPPELCEDFMDKYGLPELCEDACNFLDEFVEELSDLRDELPSDSVLHAKAADAIAALKGVISEAQRDPVLEPLPPLFVVE